MRLCLFKFILFTLACVTPEAVADHERLNSHSAISSSAKPPRARSRTVASAHSEKTRSDTLSRHSAISSSIGSKGKPPHSSYISTGFSSRSQKMRPQDRYSSTDFSSRSQKTPHNTYTITSISPSPSGPKSSVPAQSNSTTPWSSPPTRTTVTTSTPKKIPSTTTTNEIIPTSNTASEVTVRNGHTASAQVGWLVVGAGIGGFVAVGGNILPIAGGTEAIIIENSSGQDELSPVDTSTASSTSLVSASSSSTSSSLTLSSSTSSSSALSSLTSSSLTLLRSTSSSSALSSSTSSSSAAASPTPYNIYPRPGLTSGQQLAFERDLQQITQPRSVQSITGVRDKLLLWVASLTPAQASELSNNPVVRSLNVDQPVKVHSKTMSADGTFLSSNCPLESCSHAKRDGTIMMQPPGLLPIDDLKMFSQANSARLSDLPGYVYDSIGGRGITVYVIDSGINPNHPEFTTMQGSLRWLYLPDAPQIQDDITGHGTCVASKVTGPAFGVAKNANLVIVKAIPQNARARLSHLISAWAVVARDIDSEDLVGKAVVTTSLGFDPSPVSEDDKLAYIESIRDVIELDAAVVTASGNINTELPGHALALYPALLGNELPLVVVGGVDTSGIYASFSQGLAYELTVSADATPYCALGDGSTTRAEGTSFAAPAVAGLAAYLMSLDQYRSSLQVQGSVASNVRNLIKSLAYPRLALQPAVVWNGIDSRQYHCPVQRDTGPSGCPVLNTTTNQSPKGSTTFSPVYLPVSPTTSSSITNPSPLTTGSSSPAILSSSLMSSTLVTLSSSTTSTATLPSSTTSITSSTSGAAGTSSTTTELSTTSTTSETSTTTPTVIYFTVTVTPVIWD